MSFWRPLDSELRWVRLTSILGFEPVQTFTLPHPAASVATVRAAGGSHALMVVYTPARHNSTASMGRLLRPCPAPLFNPPAGQFFGGVLVTLNGDFHLLRAGPDGRSSGTERYTWNGSTYAHNGSTTLPPLRSATRRAPMFFAFTANPLLSTDAILLGAYSAGDWTRNGGIALNNIQIQRGQLRKRHDRPRPLLRYHPRPSAPRHPPLSSPTKIPSGVAGLPSYASAIGTVPPIGRTHWRKSA